MKRLSPTLLLLALAGCGADDPYNNSDLWQPTGANAGNLAAMAARPRDLVQGRGRPTGDVKLSADAIERVWSGRVLPLSTTSGASAAGGANSGRSTN